MPLQNRLCTEIDLQLDFYHEILYKQKKQTNCFRLLLVMVFVVLVMKFFMLFKSFAQGFL